MAPIEDLSPSKAGKEEEPDSPLVVSLKELDDKVLEAKRAFDKAKSELRKKFSEKQKPLLEQRSKKLMEGEEKTGTPAVKGFWLTALKNHPEFRDRIEKYDEPVLEHLEDITVAFTDEDDHQKGFKLDFKFATNPYFTNTNLTVEYVSQESSPYRDEIDVTEVKATKVNWNSGKDITVEKVKKQAKGKSGKQKATTAVEPRDSFFRGFFRNLKEGGELPEDVDEDQLMLMTGGEDVDEDAFMDYLIEDSHDLGCSLRDNIIPFAVRWYTGEAAPEEDDEDDEDDDDDDDDDEDDDDDDDESEEETPKGKPGKKSPQQKKKGSPKDAPKEECKQQ